ncbi:uncharacterized protein LOC18771072 [Prunus persica]|uniref:uncharacterized protein LOC18771072 n=1 Tax=Prunus persica TaxID=3760 RepID=UPI0009AB5BDB|nr:uncharacterized protein LOC18771072 [Prunus persica]
MTDTDDPGHYLGLPTMWGRSKKDALSFVKDRLLCKVQGWKQGLLSQAGRETLSKSVALAIPTYPMSIFLFPKGFCSELDAPKSARASWAWSSLLAGRDLILRGARWQILDGSRVHLWTDKWLPCVANPILRPTDGSTRDDTLMVSTIINPISMQWNLSSICDAISDRDLEIFLTLPLGDGSESDRVIWPLNRNGDYSVKSGYHLIHSGDSSNVHLCPSSLHAPTNVLRKAFESLEHLFLLCGSVKLVWFGVPMNYCVDRQRATSMAEWLYEVFGPYSSLCVDRAWIIYHVAYTCWGIWRSRYAKIFDGSPLCPRQTLSHIKCMISDFDLLKDVSHPMHQPGTTFTIDDVWSPPPAAWCKLNVDARWTTTHPDAGLGVVIRNSCGVFMGGFAACKIANSVLEAEAHAAIAGLSLEAEMGLANVIIKSNSQVLVNCSRGKICKGIWSIYPILSTIRRCCNNFISCDWRWISCQANRAADAVAAIARRTKCDRLGLTDPPSSLVFVLQSDGLPCPMLISFFWLEADMLLW